jgi:hypothetical protein
MMGSRFYGLWLWAGVCFFFFFFFFPRFVRHRRSIDNWLFCSGVYLSIAVLFSPVILGNHAGFPDFDSIDKGRCPFSKHSTG